MLGGICTDDYLIIEQGRNFYGSTFGAKYEPYHKDKLGVYNNLVGTSDAFGKDNGQQSACVPYLFLKSYWLEACMCVDDYVIVELNKSFDGFKLSSSLHFHLEDKVNFKGLVM